MATVEWGDRYKVNVLSMDVQHRKLIDMLGEMSEKIKEGKTAEIGNKILRSLREYAAVHLEAEEKLLKEHKYPGYEEHKKLHDDLKRQLTELDAIVAKQPLAGTLKLSTFLYTWLNSHILIEDKKYSAYLNSKGVK